MILFGPLSVAAVLAGVWFTFGGTAALVTQFVGTILTFLLLLMTMPPDLKFKWRDFPRAFAEVFFTWPIRFFHLMIWIFGPTPK